MCQYGQAATIADHLREVVERRAAGIQETLLSTANAEGELILADEIDKSNEELLATALW